MRANPPLLRHDADAIATLTLDLPAERNPLSEAMLRALTQELEDIAATPAIRAVIVAANGPVFSAGHHLKELDARRADPDRGRAYFAEIMRRCSDLMLRLTRLPQPVIAAVEGTATAAGCQLVATCDLAVAGEAARFSTPGVHIGLFCSTPMVALSRNLGAKQAMEMLLLGETIDSSTALRFGLVNRVVPAGEALGEARRLASRITAKSALTVRTGKQAFYRQREMTLEEAYAYAAGVMVDNMLARDAEEGISAFIEKRAPVWEDR